MIKYPKKVDYKKIYLDTNNNETRYGLPEKVLYCKKCVISNQKTKFHNRVFSVINNKKKKLLNLTQIFVMHAIFL